MQVAEAHAAQMAAEEKAKAAADQVAEAASDSHEVIVKQLQDQVSHCYSCPHLALQINDYEGRDDKVFLQPGMLNDAHALHHLFTCHNYRI